MKFLSQLLVRSIQAGFASLILAVNLGVGQVTAPSEPYLAKLPANSSWMATYSPLVTVATDKNAPSPSPSAHPKHHRPASPTATRKPTPTPTPSGPPLKPVISILSITVARNNDLRREITLWSDQSKTEKWIVKNYIFTQSSSGDYRATSADSAGIDSDYPDFPQFVWIDKGHFRSIEKKNGKTCFLYVWTQSGEGLRPVDSPIPTEPTKVWVSVESKLPVAMEDEHVTVTFDYNLPVPQLVLPPQCNSLLDEITNMNKRVENQQMVRP